MTDERTGSKSKLNIVLSEEDKKFLKMYALKRDTTVSAVIHAYVEELRKEADADANKH